MKKMIIPRKNDEYIKGLLREGEGETLEFKLAINQPEKFAKTIAAFANHMGGLVVIGINDHRKSIGVDVDEEIHMLERAAQEFLSEPVVLEYDIYETSPDFEQYPAAINLLLVSIPKSPKKVFVTSVEKGPRYYVRQLDRNKLFNDPSDPNSPPKVSLQD